jgi:hypothetical protein
MADALPGTLLWSIWATITPPFFLAVENGNKKTFTVTGAKVQAIKNPCNTGVA